MCLVVKIVVNIYRLPWLFTLQMTAVVNKRGELKILSATEDSDLDLTPATR